MKYNKGESNRSENESKSAVKQTTPLMSTREGVSEERVMKTADPALP